jgi:uncharacterized protein YecE (DUF72 family)
MADAILTSEQADAAAARIRVGTASWTDKTLIASGRFYPKGASTAEARLRFYASQFSLVEVDSSYYAMPTPQTAQLWAERTPEGFVMHVKAFRLFTGHPAEPRVMHADLREALGGAAAPARFYGEVPPEIQAELWLRFREALLPLRASGRLGLVHFQFPPWLTADAAGRAQIEHCVERMAGHDLSVEFRHRSWFASAEQTRSTIAFLREMGVAHTVVDGPQGFPNSVPAVWETTHPRFALLRLHGRNAKTWNIRGATSASDRFNYDYPEEELAEVAARVVELSQAVPVVHAVMNNNYEDQGQRNAKTLTKLLKAPKAADS